MKILIRSAVSAGLLLTIGSCSSNSTSTSTTKPVTSTVSSGATNGSTAASGAATVAPTGTPQEQVIEQTLAYAKTAGLAIEEACLRTAVAKLSDADAKLIAATGPEDTPTGLSEAGVEVGNEVVKCISLSENFVAPTTPVTTG